MTRWRRPVHLVLAVLLVVGAACGGDDGDVDDVVDVAPTVEEETATTTEAPAELDLTAGCADAEAAYETLRDAVPDVTTSNAALQLLEANVEVFEDWADVAPEAVDDEMDVLAEAYARVADAAAANRFSPEGTDPPPEELIDAIDLLASEEVVYSADLVTEYFEAGCPSTEEAG